VTCTGLVSSLLSFLEKAVNTIHLLIFGENKVETDDNQQSTSKLRSHSSALISRPWPVL